MTPVDLPRPPCHLAFLLDPSGGARELEAFADIGQLFAKPVAGERRA